MRPIVIPLICAFLASCATTPVPTSEAKPASAILNSSMTIPRPMVGQVIIKRDMGVIGSVCAIRASVNGKPLADLRIGEIVVAYLEPGDYVLGASSTGICGGGDAEAGVSVRIGEVRTYRISIDPGASIRIGPTAY